MTTRRYMVAEADTAIDEPCPNCGRVGEHECGGRELAYQVTPEGTVPMEAEADSDPDEMVPLFEKQDNKILVRRAFIEAVEIMLTSPDEEEEEV